MHPAMNALLKLNLLQFLWNAAEKNEKKVKGVKNTGFYLEQISKKEYSEKYEIIVKICTSTWKLPDKIIKNVLIPLFGTERAYCGLLAFRGGGKMKFSKDAWSIRRDRKILKNGRDTPTPPPPEEIQQYISDSSDIESIDALLSLKKTTVPFSASPPPTIPTPHTHHHLPLNPSTEACHC